MTRALVLAIAVLAAAPSAAQTTGPRAPPFAKPPAAAAESVPRTGNLIEDAFNQLHAGLQKAAKDIADKALADLQAALTDATNHNDLISQPCWQAQIDFLKLLPAEWPTPPTDIGPALAIQIKRDLTTALTGSDAKSIKVACAAMLGDELKIFAQIGAMFGLRVATGGAL